MDGAVATMWMYSKESDVLFWPSGATAHTCAYTQADGQTDRHMNTNESFLLLLFKSDLDGTHL